MNGHLLDIITDITMIAKIVKIAIMVEGGLIKLYDTEISWLIDNLCGMGYNSREI